MAHRVERLPWQYTAYRKQKEGTCFYCESVRNVHIKHVNIFTQFLSNL